MRYSRVVATALVIAVLLGLGVQGQSVLSVCDYAPPQSRLTALGLQGSFLWYDGPYTDDRMRSLTATAAADYSLLVSTETSGHELAARTELRVADGDWAYELDGSGDIKAYIEDDVFAIGALEATASDASVEVDATVGIGTGRFRDVTPLATAIRVQNALLDLGVLIAPLEADVLSSLAQVLGEIGPTDEERILTLAQTLVGTGLVSGDDVGVLGLLAIEGTMDEAEAGRVCGQDVQLRVGVSAALLPEINVAATGIAQYNLALVPDPITQITASLTGKIRLANLERFALDGSITYSRRLPDDWAARATYRIAIDRRWTTEEETGVEHVASASLTTQIAGSIGLSVVGELRYEIGDEEMSSSLTIHLSYNLF